MDGEQLGTRQPGDINRAPNQWEQRARNRKASDLAEFLKRRGITHTALQTMHPAILEHHWRSAGLKSAPSPETMALVAKHMAPSKAQRSAEEILGLL